MSIDDLDRFYTHREIMAIEARQRQLHLKWRMAKLRRQLPFLALAFAALSALVLAVLIEANL